jgi:hypothetical protein
VHAAAVSVVHADNEVPKLLESALHDVGLAYYPKGSDAAQENGLRLMASRVLSGHLTPIALAAWAHATFDHGTLELVERLVELDDIYDTLEYRDLTADDLDADVVAEARTITTLDSVVPAPWA